MFGKARVAAAYAKDIPKLWKLLGRRYTQPPRREQAYNRRPPYEPLENKDGSPVFKSNDMGDINSIIENHDMPCDNCSCAMFFNYKIGPACLCCGQVWQEPVGVEEETA